MIFILIKNPFYIKALFLNPSDTIKYLIVLTVNFNINRLLYFVGT